MTLHHYNILFINIKIIQLFQMSNCSNANEIRSCEAFEYVFE